VAAIFGFDKPLLAAVQGVAVGGGCTIAVASDIVYVGESVRMRLPFANLGLVPEIASSYTLQASIGRQRAAELMFTAEWIDAERAVEVGMAARSFPDDELLSASLAKAREIAQWPVSALRGIKQTLQVAHRAGIEAAIEVEDRLMGELAGSPENIEAVKAFMEKRTPDFKQFRTRD
jgi:enoyl-CoA hydratase/carnithine racemase